jgi:hypothetical protein
MTIEFGTLNVSKIHVRLPVPRTKGSGLGRAVVMKSLELAYESQRALLNLKQSSVSLSIGDRKVYAFDLDGKPLSFWMSDMTFIWALDCRAIKKWHDPGSRQKQIREADPAERDPSLSEPGPDSPRSRQRYNVEAYSLFGRTTRWATPPS